MSSIELVLHRYIFYQKYYRQMVLIVFLLGMLSLGLFGLIWYQPTIYPKPKYFPVAIDGRPIIKVPLYEKMLSTEHVLAWAEKALLRVYDLDFAHPQDAFREMRDYFTWEGYHQFLAAFEESKNMNTVTAKKYIVSAAITGPSKILKEVLGGGHPAGWLGSDTRQYGWWIEIPVTLTYENAVSHGFEQHGVVTLLVIRVSNIEYQSGIAIHQMIFEERRSSE
jgi:hypothetical protein